MVEHLLIAFLFVLVMPVNSVYSISEVNEISKEIVKGQDILNFILDTVSIAVLVLLTLVLITVGVLIFLFCQCSPSSTARSADENEYRYTMSLPRKDVLDFNSNEKDRKNNSNARTARKLSSILECQLDPVSVV